MFGFCLLCGGGFCSEGVIVVSVAMAMAVSLPALAARPHCAGAQARAVVPSAVALRDGMVGCKVRATPVWKQDVGGMQGAQLPRNSSAGVVSCSVAPTKEDVPDAVQRAGASGSFNVLITGSTKGELSFCKHYEALQI